ncbi:hypothetical protein J4212_03820 [Candidatus Woesearchaeota archaeon]|nr:hypothetical protein [Candidatus Woesearchaeota archaeon]
MERKKDFEALYRKNLELTKKQVREAVNEDLLIIQAISSVGDIDKTANLLSKRLREWFALYNPELEHRVKEHEEFVKLVIAQNEKKADDSMGKSFEKEDFGQILSLAGHINSLYELRQQYFNYLEKILKKYCPSVLAITGPIIGAKLFGHAGSLRKLAVLPSSTIQLLGAEKALFRHLQTRGRAKSPKHGILSQHPVMGKVKFKEHGKAARVLADKISLAARIDYFKGQYAGDKLRKEIEEKFGKWE